MDVYLTKINRLKMLSIFYVNLRNRTPSLYVGNALCFYLSDLSLRKATAAERRYHLSYEAKPCFKLELIDPNIQTGIKDNVKEK